jgi:hypothetical protein
MRWGSLLMLILSGCQFQVAARQGGGEPDLALGGIIETGPDPTARIDLATQSIPDLAPPAPPIVPIDMASFKPASSVGAACKTTVQCGGNGLVCVEQVGVGKTKVQFPGGHCTRDCTNDACPADSVCTKEGGGFNICMAQCPPVSCRAGYRCCAAAGVCAPADSCD